MNCDENCNYPVLTWMNGAIGTIFNSIKTIFKETTFIQQGNCFDYENLCKCYV